jgi:NTE family protein
MRLGLALSGGAVRGAAHVGALMALENAGLRPAAIAGTSIGAMVGALYAAGVSAGDLALTFTTANWNLLLGPRVPTALSLFDARPTERLLRERFGLTTFAALRTPFAAVACDIAAGHEVVLREGDVVAAVRASSAIPGIYPPVAQGEQLLVDGGMVNNLPIDVVRAMGVDKVLAVDLLPPWRALGTPTRMVELWERSLNLLVRGNHPPPGTADVLVQPAIAAFSLSDFGGVDEMIRLGRLATERALAESGLLAP